MQQREAEGGRTGTVAAVHEKENINIQYKIGFNGRGKVVEKNGVSTYEHVLCKYMY